MTCRESRLSSAIVTFARDMTGLEDNQILALNHALMQEGSQHGVSEESWAAIIDATQEQYRNGLLSIGNRSRDPLSRLDAARTENPDAGRAYAATRLIERARLADEAQQEYLTDVARDLGQSYEQVQRAFQGHFADATEDASAAAEPEFVRAWNVNPDHSGMLVDRRSLYAFSALEAARTESLNSHITAGTPEEVFNSQGSGTNYSVQQVFYTPQTGHTVAHFTDANGTTRREEYNIPAHIMEDLRGSDHFQVENMFRNEIRNSDAYRYATEEDAVRGRQVINCPTCGQFRSRMGNHACAVPGSPAARDADLSRAVASVTPPVAAPATENRLVYTHDPVTGSFTRPAIVNREQIESSFIREIGYDPISGRLELCFRDSAHVYPYQMTPEQYEEFRNSASMGSYFTTSIRNNPAYHFESDEQELASRTLQRCGDCGQFRSSVAVHDCPDITELHTEDIDLTRTGQNITPAEFDAALTSLQTTLEAQNPSTLATGTPEVSTQRTTRYEIEGTVFRLPGMRRLQREARENGTVVTRVFATGAAPENNYTVGLVAVTYENGRYTVAPVEDGLNSRRLRCNCEDYQRNYRCEHTVEHSARLARGLNGETQAEIIARSATMGAVDAANAAAALEIERAAASQIAATERFTPMATSFSENPEEFQGLYEEFRAKREEYRAAVAEGRTDVEYPVPYMRENALGGLATRESGRGFGIEVEFAFPQDMSAGDRRNALRAIGRELYESGLTRTQDQQGYGASHGWFRDTHDRGWSFESDPSTGGSDGQHGGEIVSPVMFDEPETWAATEKIAEVLTRNGAIASKGSGMHVHVGTGDYGQNVANHNRLLNAFATNEDLLYRLGSSPERGRHRGTGYCSPNHMPSTPYSDVSRARSGNNGHHIGLNFQSINGRSSDHMELRAFDATLKPGPMQAQIAMAVYMTEAAVRGVGSETPNEGQVPLGSRLGSNPSRGGLTGSAWTESTAGFRSFLDKFVPGSGANETENPRVRQLVALFASTKWQKSGGRSW